MYLLKEFHDTDCSCDDYPSCRQVRRRAFTDSSMVQMRDIVRDTQLVEISRQSLLGLHLHAGHLQVGDCTRSVLAEKGSDMGDARVVPRGDQERLRDHTSTQTHRTMDGGPELCRQGSVEKRPGGIRDRRAPGGRAR